MNGNMLGKKAGIWETGTAFLLLTGLLSGAFYLYDSPKPPDDHHTSPGQHLRIQGVEILWPDQSFQAGTKPTIGLRTSSRQETRSTEFAPRPENLALDTAMLAPTESTVAKSLQIRIEAYLRQHHLAVTSREDAVKDYRTSEITSGRLRIEVLPFTHGSDVLLTVHTRMIQPVYIKPADVTPSDVTTFEVCNTAMCRPAEVKGAVNYIVGTQLDQLLPDKAAEHFLPDHLIRGTFVFAGGSTSFAKAPVSPLSTNYDFWGIEIKPTQVGPLFGRGRRHK